MVFLLIFLFGFAQSASEIIESTGELRGGGDFDRISREYKEEKGLKSLNAAPTPMNLDHLLELQVVRDVVNRNNIKLSEDELKMLKKILNSRQNLRMKTADGNQAKGREVQKALKQLGNGEAISAKGRDGLLTGKQAFEAFVKAELKKQGGNLAQLSGQLGKLFRSPKLKKKKADLPPLPGTKKTKKPALPPLPGTTPKKKKKKPSP